MLHHEYWKPKIYENREDRRVFERLANDQRLNNQYHFYDFSQIDGTYDTQRDADLVRKIRLDGLKRHLGIGTEKTAFFDHHSCHAYYALFASPIRIDIQWCIHWMEEVIVLHLRCFVFQVVK